MRECRGCGVVKPLAEYSPCGRGYRRYKCKPCEAKRQTERYRNNINGTRDRMREYGKKRHVEYYAVINEAKDVPCLDCGIQYPPYVMDFDHRPGEKKEFQVGGRAWHVKIPELKTEIAKCDVVCSNCHRERTHQRNKVSS